MTTTQRLILGDAGDLPLEDGSVDLVLCSPPYEAQRSYGIGFDKRGDEWVQWAADCFQEHLRVCRGLVAWVVEGCTHRFRWSATPALLMADLHRRGVRLRKPPAYHRVGIPGSGGPDWLRNDYEFIVCASRGRLPWSDNTACGHPPKHPPGGAMSNRYRDGRRQNAKTRSRLARRRPFPQRANPGNVIRAHGGKGHLGHDLAHENEAPFALRLAEFFVRSFCPPGGTVLDPFLGSGTTLHAAHLHGRNGVGVDCRMSQIDLAERRLRTLEPEPTIEIVAPRETA